MRGVSMTGVFHSKVISALAQFFGASSYTGTGTTNTITNGVNLSTNNGLIWTKSRSAATGNILVDTVRGISNILESDNIAAQASAGALVSGGSIASGTNSWDMCIAPDGTNVYVLNQSANTISIFARNTSTGVLSGSTTISTFGYTLTNICISPDGKSVYGTSFYNSFGLIVLYTRNTSTGALSTNGTFGLIANQVPAGLCVSGDGKNVYVCIYDTASSLCTLTRNTSTGALSGPTYLTVGSGNPTMVCMSSDNAYVYVAVGNTNLVAMFTRNTNTGVLTTGSTYSVPGNPYGICISSDGNNIYLTEDTTHTVVAFDRNTGTGALTNSRQTAANTLVGSQKRIVITADGGNVYAPITSGVATFSRDLTTGTLTTLTSTTIGSNNYCICVSPDSSDVYTASYTSSACTTYLLTRGIQAVSSVSTTGYTLGANTNVNANAATYASWAFANDPGAFSIATYTGNGAATQTVSHSLTVAPALSIIKCATSVSDWPVTMSTNNLLLDTNAATVVAGSLSGNTTITTGTSSFPYGMCIVPDGTNVYTVNQATNTISIFSRNTATGVLSGSSTFGSTSNAQRITSSPDGKNIYTVSPGTSQINVFNRNTGTGVLTTGTAVSSGSTGKDIVISPDGAFAYVTIQGGTVLTLTRNTSTGALTSGSTISAGSTPTNIIMSADGTSVYVTNNIASGTVSIFTRNTSTGVLTSAGTISTGTSSSPFGLCISPDGSNVYVANNGNNTLSIFTRNTSTGALTSAGTIATQVAPAGVAISPDGLNVYATNNTSGTVSIFTRNTSTGALSGSTTKSAGTIPYAIVISADGSDVYVSNASASTVSTFVRSTSAVPFSTSTTFTVAGAYNVSGQTYIAYLFATLASTSSVGSYTGDGTSSQIINCGFSSGSRFIMVKRTDVAGDWFVWDSTRGINASGNSPHLSWNTTAAEVTTDASVAPSNSGFIVKQVSATNINVNGGTYIYIAFA
jgi:6-phosphogluconolactonase (cycloisomerase 2 family)